MSYLLRARYRVIPVRADGCESVHGVPCVASLQEIDDPIDIVDLERVGVVAHAAVATR